LDKTIIALLGGASALALLGGVGDAASLPQAGVNSVPAARSFSELLDPIPNAANILNAQSEQAPDEGTAEAPMILAQYYQNHHHHHHHYYRRRHHHHHHHHHHHQYYYNNNY
jgi:hypothetical protein